MRAATDLPGAPATTEQDRNKATLRSLLVDVLAGGRFDLLDGLVAADVVEHQRGAASGREATRGLFETIRRGFPDLRIEVLHLDVVQDRGWIHFRATGTHTGAFAGIPPTGKAMAIDVFDLVRFEAGRVAEHWGVPDQLGLFEQLGLLGGQLALE